MNVIEPTVCNYIKLPQNFSPFFQVEILLYDISKGMAAKLGPLLLGKSAEVRTLRGYGRGS